MQKRLEFSVVKRDLSQLVDWVDDGNVVVVLRDGAEMAKLIPLAKPIPPKRTASRNRKK